MTPFMRLKQGVLLAGDALLFYVSLGLTLVIRYRVLSEEVVALHLFPFTIVFVTWFFIIYITGLYDIRELKNNQEFARKIASALVTAALVSIVLFYLVPAFGITPKTNLIIFFGLFGLASYVWRTSFNTLLAAGRPANRILLVGYNKTAEELVERLTKSPQLGYEVAFWMKEGLQDKEFEHLSQIIIANNINMIVVPAHLKKEAEAARLIYKNLVLGIEVIDLATLYEKVFVKVPVAELEEVWFLDNLAKSHRAYDSIKGPLERLIAIPLILLFLPVGIVAALVVWLTSRGPVIFAQKRIGQYGKMFTIYKFRTMRQDAERHGPQWANFHDARATAIGRILRKTHIDELPQLINLLKGDVSLVGPRPERPEFVEKLREDIPFYELRHLVRPGITGWSQINYKYGASTEDAYEKLQYELFYMKHRSFILDLAILIRTIKYFFVTLR